MQIGAMWVKPCWMLSSPRSSWPPHLVFNLRSEHTGVNLSQEFYLSLVYLDHEIAALPSVACCFTSWKCSILTYTQGLEIGSDDLKNTEQLTSATYSSRHLVPNTYYNPEKGRDTTKIQIVITFGGKEGDANGEEQKGMPMELAILYFFLF